MMEIDSAVVALIKARPSAEAGGLIVDLKWPQDNTVYFIQFRLGFRYLYDLSSSF